MYRDPTFRTTARDSISTSKIDNNIQSILPTFHQFLDLSHMSRSHRSYHTPDTIYSSPSSSASYNSALSPVIINNYNWMSNISLIEYLSSVSSHFHFNDLNKLDRPSSSLSEFMYQTLQAYDFYHLYMNYNCQLQIGGSDQWNNILQGISYINKRNRQQYIDNNDHDNYVKIRNDIYGMTLPLILNNDGTKIGKSNGGSTISLSHSYTSSYKYYQFFRNVNDNDVQSYLKKFTFIDIDEIKDICENNISQASSVLAEHTTLISYGEEGLKKAKRATKALYEGKVIWREWKSDDILELFIEDMKAYDVNHVDDIVAKKLVDIIYDYKLINNKKEIENLMMNRGIYISDKHVKDMNYYIQYEDVMTDGLIMLQLGKRKFNLIKIKQ